MISYGDRRLKARYQLNSTHLVDSAEICEAIAQDKDSLATFVIGNLSDFRDLFCYARR